MVMLEQASGDFTLPPTVPSKLLFITAGSGITPVMGMLRGRLTDPDVAADVVLLHSTPTVEDLLAQLVEFDTDLLDFGVAEVGHGVGFARPFGRVGPVEGDGR